MSKAMMRDEDAQVIQMVNTRTADRRRRAEETAAKMVVIAEDRQARDEDFCRRKMQLGRVAECAGKAVRSRSVRISDQTKPASMVHSPRCSRLI